MGFLEREIFVKWVYQSEKKKKQTDKRLKDDGGRGGDEKGVSGRRASEREKDNIALI